MKFDIVCNGVKESFTPPLYAYNQSVNQLDSNNKSRIPFIDLAKGVCILLVVLFHLSYTIFGIPNFRALRMPLYFTLSGLFFKSYGDMAVFTLKKVNNILVPFLFWLLAGYLLQSLFYGVRIHEIYPVSKLLEGFTNRYLYPIPSVWFLLCLFITNILFYLLNRFLEGPALAAGVLALALAGCAADARGIYLPLWFDSACTAMPFFYMGYMLKKSPLLHQSTSRRSALFTGVCCIGAAYLIWFLFGKPYSDFRVNSIGGNRLAFYLDSCFFVLGVLLLCKAVRWLPVVSYFGRYSLVVLCTHELLNLLLIQVQDAVHFFTGYTLPRTAYIVLILPLCWLSIPLCTRFLPWFVAQKPLIRYPSQPRESAPGIPR